MMNLQPPRFGWFAAGFPLELTLLPLIMTRFKNVRFIYRFVGN